MFDGLALPTLRSTRPARQELDQLDGVNRTLVGYWPCDEAGGKIIRDVSPRRAHAVIDNTANMTSTITKHGRARYMNGSGAVSATLPSLPPLSKLSLFFWVKTTSTSNPLIIRAYENGGTYAGWAVIIGYNNAADPGRLAFYSSNNPGGGWIGSTSNTYNDGALHSCAVIFDGTNVRFYRDGVPDGVTASSAPGTYTGSRAILEGNTQFAARNIALFSSALTDADVRKFHRNPNAGLIDPADRLFFAFKAGTGAVSVTLTGIGSTFSAGTLLPTRSLPITGAAATASAGTVAPARTLPLSGQALSSAAGTVATSRVLSITGQAITSGIGTVSVGSNVSVSLTGIVMTAAAGTTTAGHTVAITGAAMTLSAGSVAYSAAFSLVGIATTGSTGTVSAPTGDQTFGLTGLSMTVSPGNVRVTGGTKWVPQAARAVAIATAAGNTLPPPPRLTGDAKTDIQAQGQWLATLYDQLVKVNNVFGRINDHETRIAVLEASNDNTH